MAHTEPHTMSWSEFSEPEIDEEIEYTSPEISGTANPAEGGLAANTDLPITLPLDYTTNKKEFLIGLVAFFAVLALGLYGLYVLEQSQKVDFSADGNAIAPDTVAASMKSAVNFANKGASNFNGKWGEWHKEMIASGEEKRFNDYERQVSYLRQLMDQSQLYNVYILYDGSSGDSAADQASDRYKVSIDMDGRRAFGESVLPTAAIVDAWNGKATADPNPWDYKFDTPVWTSYAPIYDKNSEIVAVLCVDYPVPMIRSYPEWNKSSKRWKGYPVQLGS